MVSATFRVITPLFLGGAEPTKDCDLRTASIKGAMLFWWRALKGADPELRQKEQTLFGSSDLGQSQWLLDAQAESLNRGLGKLELDEGRGYLAGQGLAKPRQVPQQHQRPHRRFAGGGTDHRPAPFESHRPYLRPGGRIHLRAFRRTRGTDGDGEAESIRDALVALTTFGGLGSRSRRGFGSLHLEQLVCGGEARSLETFSEPTGLEDWAARISRLLGGISHSALPRFTHFADDTRILVLEAAQTSAEELHEALGRSFRSFRSYKLAGGVGGLDHDDMAAWLGGAALEAPPRRAAFGLPHNYYFSSTGTAVGVGPAGKLNRRASPLFLHLDEVGDAADRHAIAVLTFLPAAFLPPGEKIQVKSGGRSCRLSPRAVPGLWQPIRDWLDELHREPPCNAHVWKKP